MHSTQVGAAAELQKKEIEMLQERLADACVRACMTEAERTAAVMQPMHSPA